MNCNRCNKDKGRNYIYAHRKKKLLWCPIIVQNSAFDINSFNPQVIIV